MAIRIMASLFSGKSLFLNSLVLGPLSVTERLLVRPPPVAEFVLLACSG